ncbi:hypothetical protein HBB16_09800 [Pseudonocardia sp. MCCB 268]|nr:hypothetical protein [Pseudonocardia cytotoxica]
MQAAAPLGEQLIQGDHLPVPGSRGSLGSLRYSCDEVPRPRLMRRAFAALPDGD